MNDWDHLRGELDVALNEATFLGFGSLKLE